MSLRSGVSPGGLTNQFLLLPASLFPPRDQIGSGTQSCCYGLIQLTNWHQWQMTPKVWPVKNSYRANCEIKRVCCVLGLKEGKLTFRTSRCPTGLLHDGAAGK